MLDVPVFFFIFGFFFVCMYVVLSGLQNVIIFYIIFLLLLGWPSNCFALFLGFGLCAFIPHPEDAECAAHNSGTYLGEQIDAADFLTSHHLNPLLVFVFCSLSSFFPFLLHFAML